MSTPPLINLKVLDFSTLLPGPYATMMLADLGADVLRIEAPDRPDLLREAHVAAYEALNRNKRGMHLNLKIPAAVEIVKHLIQKYDIIIEQFRPGVMKSLGLDYDTLQKENPRLIYCSLTGYGQNGPLSNRAGHDINFMALSGMNSFSGTQEQGPSLLGVQVGDVAGGSMFSVIGILSAVLHRDKTGEGQHVDVSMLDGTIAQTLISAVEWLEEKKNPDYETGLFNGGSYYNNYRTKDGRYLSIAAMEPKFFKILLKVLELPESFEIIDQVAFRDLVRQKIITKTLAEWTAIFEPLDACVEPVLTMEEMEQHPQVQARDMIIHMNKTDGTTQKQLAHPVKFSKSSPVYEHVGPVPGEHSEEVLQEFGYSADEIKQFRDRGVLG
ncbi:MAG: CoA transferase [SAR324 cluster bacterium]|nr:CoA transferase [SAR324 cluster bacterium]